MNYELIAVLCFALLIFGVVAVRWQRNHVRDLDDFNSRWQPVDVAALLNLIDDQEEIYLKRNLPANDFRFIYRKRLVVIWEYLSRLSANTKLMVRAGQMIQHASEGAKAVEARELVASSIQLRMIVLLAQCSIAARFVFPQVSAPIATLVRRYSEITSSFGVAAETYKMARVLVSDLT